MKVPRVTVLMPVYNAQTTLREAIDSILGQTFTDFEFLIIDDGSSDSSADIIRSYDDPRIRFIQNDRNLKLTSTLNKGLDLADGEYVARMDADDISQPERLARQVDFLDVHPEVGIVGVWARAFGEANFLIPQPADPEVARAKLLFDSCLVHPAVLIRRNLLDLHRLRYQPLSHFEDYELWQRAARLFPIANIPEWLFRYRVTGQSAFFGANRQEQEETYRRIDQVSLPFLGIVPTDAELSIHNFLRRPEGSRTAEAEAWLLKLSDANTRTNYYEHTAFRETLRERWFLVCYLTGGGSLGRWWRYVSSPLYERHYLSGREQIKVLAKFLLQRLRGRLGF
jgi:glycosyltransferase involved in cell wall biosynthesis